MGSNISSVAATAADRVVGSVLPKSFEIVMIGLDNAGKTSLVNRFKRRELPSGVLPATTTTIGSTIETIPFGRHSVTIRELGGADKIRPLWRRFFWNGHGFIFAVDASAPERFAEAKEELGLMWAEISEEHPILILANRMDLAGAAELHRISEALGVEELRVAKRRTVDIKAISAMTGEGTDEVLEWFVENISHQLIVEHNEAKTHVIQAW
ncbi:ADP-ribosylation factor family-domain-containing protein [Mycena alexandri]|uniref:ADP-ribosylation factor n=1 Tax=Mycena alexandri TaxID=1745969 RepID=A0AAD6RW71_9AGAR|nr:ADP-ribosylation factor family-domain-containing protein [Mycena alexandri]